MMGKLGFDIVVSKLSETDLQFCQQAVATYKLFSDIVWHGNQYRLVSPWDNDIAAVMYVADDKSDAIVFNYLVNNRYGAGSLSPVRLKGLDASKKYSVKEINLYPGTKSTLDGTKEYSGDYLMTIGINPDVNARRSSVILDVEEVNKK